MFPVNCGVFRKRPLIAASRGGEKKNLWLKKRPDPRGLLGLFEEPLLPFIRDFEVFPLGNSRQNDEATGTPDG
jgi:hypothetical protein